MESFASSATVTEQNESPLSPAVNKKFRTYRYRFVVLGIVVLLQIASSMEYLIYAPVADTAALFFGTKTSTVNALSIVYFVIYVVFAGPGAWLLSTRGLRFNLLIGAGMNAVGAIIKGLAALSDDHHARVGVTFFGHILSSISSVTIQTFPTIFVAEWFSETERTEANMVASLSNPIGLAIASVIAPSIVSQPSDMLACTWIFAAPSILGLLLVIFAFSDRPPTPPSGSAAVALEPFVDGLKAVLKNKPFVLLTLSFGIAAGAVSTLLNLMQQVLGGRGYTDAQAGYISALLIFIGLVGAVITSIFADKTRKYLFITKTNFVMGSLLVTAFSIASTHSGQFGAIAAISSLFGAATFGVLPVALELGVECSFPVSEGTSAGALWLSAQIFAAIILAIMDALKGKGSYYPNATNNNTLELQPDFKTPVWFMSGTIYAATLMILFLNTQYRRMEAERAALLKEGESSEAELLNLASAEAAIAVPEKNDLHEGATITMTQSQSSLKQNNDIESSPV